MTSSACKSYDQLLSFAQPILNRCGAWGEESLQAARRGVDGLVGMTMPIPREFSDPEEFAKAYQAYSLLRKLDWAPGFSAKDLAKSALDGFLQSEVVCGQINHLADSLPFLPGVLLEQQPQSLIESARGYIARALGKFDSERFQCACSFSNGASTGCSRKRGHASFKLGNAGRKPHVTINCRELALSYIKTNELWREYAIATWGPNPFDWVEVVQGSRFESVPKTVKTDRPICIEPDLNMFFQKGIGKMIREQLRKVGIDLNQQWFNQLLAEYGSLTGSLATIDLSSASDSISLRLCELLLPPDWWAAIRLTRSSRVLLPGKLGWHVLEKVSSMGNGFTFELESLLFWGLMKASKRAVGCDRTSSVYGDDIVCGPEAGEVLIRVLDVVGFKTNTDKTFLSGPFRESCGKHFFRGVDVTPFAMKEVTLTWANLYHYANSAADWLRARMTDDIDIANIVESMIEPIPVRKRCYVPRSFGSKAGLIVEQPRSARWRKHGKRPQTWSFRVLTHVQTEHDLTGPHAYLAAMLEREQGHQSVVPRTTYGLQTNPHLREFAFGFRESIVCDVRAVGDGYYRVSVAHTSTWH